MLSNKEVAINQIEAEIERKAPILEKLEKLERLEANEEYQEIFLKGIFETEALNLVRLRQRQGFRKDTQDRLLAGIDGISYIMDMLNFIKIEGTKAREEIKECRETISQIEDGKLDVEFEEEEGYEE